MNPRPDKIREMVAAFREYDLAHPNAKDLAMLDFNSKDREEVLHSDYCGSPGCHAGLFDALFCPKAPPRLWTYGGDLMGEFLGMGTNTPGDALLSWANDHPELWGNQYGYSMFCRAYAFTGLRSQEPETRTISIAKVANHWEGVADRIETFERNKKND